MLGVRAATSLTLAMPAAAIVAAVSTVIDSGTFCTFSVTRRAVTTIDSSCEEVAEVSSAWETTRIIVVSTAAAHNDNTFGYCDILPLLQIFDGLPRICPRFTARFDT